MRFCRYYEKRNHAYSRGMENEFTNGDRLPPPETVAETGGASVRAASPVNKWPDEKRAQFISLWNAQYTFRDILRIMDLSKGAGIGQARRLNLSFAALKPPVKRAPPKPHPKRAGKRKPGETDIPRDYEAFPSDSFTPETREPVGCLWIEGNPTAVFRYCQAPRRANSSYCERHHDRVFKPYVQRTAAEVAEVVREAGIKFPGRLAKSWGTM